MIVAGIVIIWDFVCEVGLLSLTWMWVIPALYPKNAKGFVSFVVVKFLILGTIFLALFLGQNCLLPRLGLLSTFPIFLCYLFQILVFNAFGTVYIILSRINDLLRLTLSFLTFVISDNNGFFLSRVTRRVKLWFLKLFISLRKPYKSLYLKK